jgi:KaiC/GvpD/RAD55 family RecA-like ATPase
MLLDVIADLEDSLIGKIMVDPSTIPDVLKVIEPADLSPTRGAVLEVCVAQHEQGLACELASVVWDLERSGKLNLAGGPATVTELAGREATAVDVVDFARKLKRAVFERKRREFHTQAAAGDEAAARRIRELDEQIEHAAAPRKRRKVLTFDEVTLDTTPQAVVEGLLFEGSPTLYCGLPKRGKTYSAAQLAVCLATGRDFIGLRVQRSRVLYLSWELAAAPLLERMKNIARDVGLPDPVLLVNRGEIKFYTHLRSAQVEPIDLSVADGWTALQDLVEDSGADVLIIDTVSKVAAIEMKDVTGWHALINHLNAFARQHNISVLAIDHAHRQRIEENASVAAMGAQVKGSAIPCIAKLTETRDDDPSAKRWKIEVDSWYGDSTPTWFRRPELVRDGAPGAGVGCIAADPPEQPNVQTIGGRCEEWLRSLLASGPPRAKHQVVNLGKEAGFNERAVQRAFSRIGGHSTKGFQGAAMWEGPTSN